MDVLLVKLNFKFDFVDIFEFNSKERKVLSYGVGKSDFLIEGEEDENFGSGDVGLKVMGKSRGEIFLERVMRIYDFFRV